MKYKYLQLYFVFLYLLCFKNGVYGKQNMDEKWLPSCDELQHGQFYCEEPEIDLKTNEYFGCSRNDTVKVNCFPYETTECVGDRSFSKYLECRYTNGYVFETALCLSIFLGCFGLDRFYLGYYATGLFKLFTFGGFIVGNLYDIVSIASQTLLPVDGSHYVVAMNGPRPRRAYINEETYFKHLPDEFQEDKFVFNN